MWGPSIIGFGDQHYKYESGREGDWFKIGFSPRKQNLTLYVTGYIPADDPLFDKLGKYTTGKACLYIKRLEDVDTGDSREAGEAGVRQRRLTFTRSAAGLRVCAIGRR